MQGNLQLRIGDTIVAEQFRNALESGGVFHPHLAMTEINPSGKNIKFLLRKDVSAKGYFQESD